MGGWQKAHHLLSNDKFQRQELGERVHALPVILEGNAQLQEAERLDPRWDIQGLPSPLGVARPPGTAPPQGQVRGTCSMRAGAGSTIAIMAIFKFHSTGLRCLVRRLKSQTFHAKNPGGAGVLEESVCWPALERARLHFCHPSSIRSLD
jgi:hypothetical protein